MAPVQDDCRNLLLSRLQSADFALLAPHLQSVSWSSGAIVFDYEAPICGIVFIDEGIASIIARTPTDVATEVGIVGREGFFPASLVIGAERTAHQIRMQIDGRGWRCGREAFVEAMGASPGLRHVFGRFAQTMVVQMSFTALSNAVHPIPERLARWLLMCHDRSSSDDLQLTHEFMALMLAVRRPSVTTALHELEGRGLIRSERGSVQIRNRSALESFARDAYGRAEVEYRDLLGPIN